MSDVRACGWALSAGLVLFLMGAALWRPAEFQAPVLADALRNVGAHRTSWLWIHVWMAIGVIVTIAGLSGLAELQRGAGDRLATPIGVTVFIVGALLWLIAIAVRVTVQEWAAGEAMTGVVPAIYPSIHRLTGLLHGTYMVLSYLSAALLGVGILRSGTLSPALGWVGVIGGAACAAAFGVFRVGLLGMPFLALVYPCALGMMLVRSSTAAAWMSS